jgi:3-hydroxyacyl-CoA dehydrogenase/enoyl-CoA hydratase/3-hydroxybutyryl-CoA epimerase
MSDMAHVHRADEGDVAVLVLDVRGRRANTLTDETFAELLDHARDIAEDSSVAAAVLASGKPDGFCAGADIDRLPELRAATHPLPALELAHDAILAVARGPKPFVAAVHGAALGGGLELALACHERVATDAEVTRFALPEVSLGLLPGAGGTQHLPLVLPLAVALEHLLTGKTMYAARARALGLVDDLVPANRLRSQAVLRARRLALTGRGAAWTPRTGPPPPAEVARVLEGARALARQRSRGLYPAPERIIDVVATGLRDGIDAGLAAEREAFVALLATPQAAAAIHLFTAVEDARRQAPREPGTGLRKVFVLGGGTMGAGIAAAAVDHGLDARVRDVDERALAGVHRHAGEALRRTYGRRSAAFDVLYRERYHRLSTTTALGGISTADVVIEAVFEDSSLKARVLAEAEARMAPGAVLASNTSAIPIGELAGACSRPEGFVGMHFFSPAERMPLVEIVPHAGTSEETLARALALARRLGKTPIVVADSPGFYTSRVFVRWLAEGMRLVLEGARIEDVDAAAERVGFPVGPLAACDEVSLRLGAHVAGDDRLAALAGRDWDIEPVREAIGALLEAGHEGRKAGLGFYRYPGGERGGAAAEVYGILGTKAGGDLAGDDLADRLLYAFVREAFACLDDGLLRTAADGDVGAVLGIGFPPNLGGPFHHVEEVGARKAVATLESLDARFTGFGVPGTLLRLAAGGGR